ncbi:hypothetical protein ACFFRR_010159 [Megaselia abdita]
MDTNHLMPSTSKASTTMNGDDVPRFKATTIGTVVVRSGPIQMVIALMQSGDKIQIKVVELEPKLTTLGDTIEETVHLQKDYEQMIAKLQKLPTPLEEFATKADKLLASKRISNELVVAMGDTLHIVWDDILKLVSDRRQILQLCAAFHEKMGSCRGKMSALEVACKDTMIPIEVDAVQEFLNKFKQLRIDVLAAVMATLKEGDELLALLQELAGTGTLDTRPDHIKRDAMRSIAQVQKWLENLYDKRTMLEAAWQNRKVQLEQCLALAILAKDLDELEIQLTDRRNNITSMSFSLGECEMTASTHLEEHTKLKHEAYQMRDRALKITRTTEKLLSNECFTLGDEACARAYNTLSQITEYMELLDHREQLLLKSRDFFGKAGKCLKVLEQLEIQLSSSKYPENSAESFALFAKVLKDVATITEEPLRMGYSLHEEVGKDKSEIKGVKRVLDEIENRKFYLEGICNSGNEEQQRIESHLKEFTLQYESLYNWLRKLDEDIFSKNKELGANEAESQAFLHEHHKCMQELEFKGEAINDLLESIKIHLASLNPSDRYDVDTKAEYLHNLWLQMKEKVLRRVDLVSLLLDFYQRAQGLSEMFDLLQKELIATPEEARLKKIQTSWIQIQNHYDNVKTLGHKYLNTIRIIADSNLDTERSSSAVEEILNKFSNRQLDVTSTIENWTTTVVEKKEIEMILEKIINENQETTRKTTTVDAQLYPVFSPTTEEPQTIQIEISEKLTSVLYELECAKRELEDRVETTLKIQTNNEESKQKINEVTTNLKSLQSKLEEIGSDYSNFLGHITNYVENVIKLRQHIDEFYSKSSSSANATTTTSMVDYENFRENCMDKFRLLIQQSEQLIERVRVLEPAGAKEHDTDRILKLLENLRIYFESRNSVKMAEIQEHEKINRFKSDYDDIVNSVNSVDKQLSEIEQQHIDSLASAKTTSIAYEYFERTVELLDNRIEHFKSTLQTYCNTAENEHTVKQKIQDLDQRWNDVKQRAKNKRISLTTITEYQTLVEKIEHEYKEIKYFLSSVSTKVPSLREPVEAGNLVNDVENYTSTRQKPLIEALNKVSTLHVDIPAKNKISTLQTEVTQLFQSFTKLKTEIRIVEEHLKTEERIREERIYKETLAKQKAEDDLKAQQLRVQEQQRLLEEQTIKETKLNEIFTEIKYSSPQFIRQLQDCSAKEGDRVIFECEVIGNPEPHIEWFKDGVSIQNNLDYKTFRSGKSCTLLIDEVFNADSATFICRASNLVGTCDTVAKLSIKEHVHQSQMTPPQILKYLENGRAREGSSYHFTVLASGNPLPTVQWFKNNICIDDSPDYVINYNNGEAVLYFEEVFLEDDAVYTCNFTNPIGFQQCSARLVVEPLEPTEIPYFRVPLTNVMSRVGQKIKLECVVGGIPRPDVYFTHNGKPYAGKNTKYENDRVTLIIPESYPKDAGTYTITAKNLAGEAYSTCHVSVKGRLPNETSDSEMASDIDPIKPSVQLPLKEVVSVFEGKPVRLDCIIVGQPEPEVIWYHNERPVKESDDVQLLFQGDRCSLLIHEAYLVDAGNYRVVAINSGGEASSICELSVTPLNIAEPATRNDKSSVAAVNNQPKFEKFLSDVLVQEGDSVTLDCVAKDVTEIKWFLTNNEISASDRIKISSDAEKGEHKITIDKVTADDKGVYTVKATNANGESKCFAQLIVKSVNVQSPSDVEQSEPKMVCPTFKELFTHKNVHLGESVKFECIVNGQPSPKIEWFFNDKLVEGDKFVISKDGDKEVLTIPDVIAESSGKIACVAENEIGKATCVAYLNLVGNGVVVPEPTSADVQSITQEHNTESSKVTIKKQVFTTTSTSEVNSYEGNIEQVAEKVTSEEKTSEIKNKEESSEQQTTLEVAQKSDSVTSIQTSTRKQKAPKFLAELVSKIVDSGVNVTMEACYEGFPSPEIKVLKNGEGLFDSEKLHITNKLNKVTIQIDDVNNADAGRYSVVATNPMGESTCTADVVVKKKIFPPVFGHRLQPQTVNIGDRVVLEVEVTGMPDPTIEWFKDGKPLEESRVSEHSIRNFGNTHTLVVEKAEISDAGKYMVRAVNDGGEAQSIANFVFVDQTQIESSSLQVEIQKETFKKEPPSFACERVDRSVGSDLHATSESKIVTEHRCTTEATMRLEHKTANLDLLPNHIQLPIPPMKYNGQTQTPPQVPPKPQKVDTQTFTQTNFEEIKTSFPEQPIPNNVIEHKESSFEKFKKMEIETLSKPRPAGPQSNGEPKYTKFVDLTPQQPILTDREMSALNITPGSPPEICFVPKPDYQKSHISDKKMEDVRTFSNGQPSPKFEENYSSTTSFVKEVKHLDNNITKGLPIYRPSAILTPAQATVDRAASPKPSADGVAMEKLWSSKHTDYESCYSEQESKYESFMSASETEPESEKPKSPFKHDLKAPFLVKQVSQKSPPKPILIPKSPIPDITLQPGSPPEICFAPKVEDRRHSLVETMERTLEENLATGPSKVLPHSVPTITPPSQKPFKEQKKFKPPPPVMPQKFTKNEAFESDYETDHWKYSGSEDETSFRPIPIQQNNYNKKFESFHKISKESTYEKFPNKKDQEFHEAKTESSYQTTNGHQQQPTPVSVPSPSKFAKTEFRESDYYSDFEEKRTSNADLQGFRSVKPPTPGRTSTTFDDSYRSVTPPSVFDRPSSTSFPTITPTPAPSARPQVFRPTPMPATKYIETTHESQPPTTTMYYRGVAGSPMHLSKMATETSNKMQIKESSETSQRYVNMEQTRKIIHFDNQEQNQRSSMPFSFSTPTPTKFVPCKTPPSQFAPCDIRESDYESEVDSAKIRPLWTPTRQLNDVRYRHVEPPRPLNRSTSVPRTFGSRILSPMEFDQGPKMPVPYVPAPQVPPPQMSAPKMMSPRMPSQSPKPAYQTQTLNRYSNKKITKHESFKSETRRDDFNLKMGPPPEYGYIEETAANQMKKLSSAFRQKSYELVDKIAEDAKRPAFKRAPSEGADPKKPYAYRDESRVSQFATPVHYHVPINAHLTREEYPKRLPLFITPLKDIACCIGQTARFECIVQSDPYETSVTWAKDNAQLESDFKKMIEFRNGVCRLTMLNITPADAGDYSCTAVNSLGGATTCSHFSVMDPRVGYRN